MTYHDCDVERPRALVLDPGRRQGLPQAELALVDVDIEPQHARGDRHPLVQEAVPYRARRHDACSLHPTLSLWLLCG